MSTSLLSDEVLHEAVRLKNELGAAAAARSINLSENAFANRLKRAAERGLVGFAPVLPGFRISQVTTTPKGDYIQQKPELGDAFEVPAGHVVKGVSALVDPDGREVLKWIKTGTDSTVPDLVAALKEAFASYEGKSELVERPWFTDGGSLSVYPIADQHNGLLAWGRETGEAYDLEIGCRRLRECMATLVSQSPRSSRAIILNLGDWQHTDDGKNMTPGGGNLLDVDSRYFKILTTGVQLMMDCIELALQKHAHVTVVNLPGNHDPHASIALTVALAAFYSNNPRVTINQDPSPFFYYRFGDTLIGATHGHKCPPERMAMGMAVNRREDWGATKFHYFFHGHFHKDTVVEIGDVRVEGFRTIAAKDAWSHAADYTSGQSLCSITYSFHGGEVGRHRINIAMATRESVAA